MELPDLSVLREPDPVDILSRDIIFNADHVTLALAAQSWSRRSPRFTFLCFLRLCGLTTREISTRPYLVERARLALRALGAVPSGRTELGPKIWSVTRPREIVPTRVTRAGYSEDGSLPPPQPFQVQVARAWLKEHGRPVRRIRSTFSTDSLRRLVTAWTEQTRAYAEIEQVNEYTGERYHSPTVYVTNGAFLQAALDEGYIARRVHVTGDAWFNLAFRKTGEPWRGRRPAAPTMPEPPKTETRHRPKRAIGDPAVIRARVVAFLDHSVRVARAEKRETFFLLKDVARAALVPLGKGLPPKVLMDVLRELGCKRARMKIDGVRKYRWYRRSHFPPRWLEPLAIRSRARVRKAPAPPAVPSAPAFTDAPASVPPVKTAGSDNSENRPAPIRPARGRLLQRRT